MSFQFKPGQRIFIYTKEVDFRLGFERLCYFVKAELSKSIVDGDLFVFLGRNRRLIKCLCFDGTGLVLTKKRLEAGQFMRLIDLKHYDITVEELDTLFNGGVVRRKVFGKIPA